MTGNPYDSSFTERLKYVVTTKGGPGEFSRNSGVSPRTLHRYLSGERLPDMDALIAMAAAGGVTIQWLTLGESTTDRTDGRADSPDGYVMIPCYGLSLSGDGVWSDERNIVDRAALQRGLAWRVLGVDPGKLAFVVAVGDHMEPVIHAGDLLLLDRSVSRFVDDAIYLIEIAGGPAIRRVQRFTSGGAVLKSENDNYDDETLTVEQVQRLRIAGRIRWIVRLI